MFPRIRTSLATVVGLSLTWLIPHGAAAVRYVDPIAEDVEVRPNLPFRDVVSGAKREPATLTLDVYLPRGDAEPSRPAILWLHGWANTTRQTIIVRLATEFAKRGYVCVSADYRQAEPGDQKTQLLRAVEDARAAVAWIRQRATDYRVDPHRIAVGGSSAGAMLGFNVASFENAQPDERAPSGIFAFVDLWGTPPVQFRLEPLSSTFPPTLIVHGAADTTAPYRDSEQFALELQKLGIKHKLVPLAGAGHGPVSEMNTILAETISFVSAQLPKPGGLRP